MGPHADQFVVQCACQSRLRISLPFAADKRARCPKCAKTLPAKSLVRANPEYRFVVRIALIFLIVGIIPIVWPAGWYLIAGIALLYALTWLKLGTEIRGWAGSKRFLRLLCCNSVKGVQEVSLWVSVGILMVCAAQFMLRVFFAVASDARVFSIEVGLAAAQSFLGHYLTLKWVLGGLACWLLIAIIWPRTVRMSHFQAGRKWIGRTVTVLTVITSFSFFSAHTVASLEKSWVAGRRQELSQSIDKIRNVRQQLVTDAYLQEQINHLSEASRISLAMYLTKAGNEQPVRDLGGEILKNEPPPDNVGNDYPDPEPPPNTGPQKPSEPPRGGAPESGLDIATEESINRVNGWVSDQTATRPSLIDVQRVTVEAARTSALLEASQSALEESLKAALGTRWHPALEPFAKVFVKSLQSSVVKTSVSKVFPRGVNSVKGALGWVKKNVHYTEGRAQWNWPIGTIEDYWQSRASLIAKSESPQLSLPERSSGVPGSTLSDPSSGWPSFPGETLGEPRLGSAQPRITVGWLIDHLACPKEDVRLASAQELNRIGPLLKSSEVGKIVKLLEDNRDLYRISPSGALFDTAPVRYYAAQALSGMDSRYLNASTRRSAGEIISQFRTPNYTRPTTTPILKAAGS